LASFKKDDTLALSVALSNGFWLTIGDSDVADSVRSDTNEILQYFRELDSVQTRRGIPNLEKYPLEAKVCLVWTGNFCSASGPYSLQKCTEKRLNLDGYRWNTVGLETLRRMRELLITRNLVDVDVDVTVDNVERLGPGKDFTETTSLANNANALFERFLVHNDMPTDWGQRATLVDSFCKAWGISTTFLTYESSNETRTCVLYFDPDTRTWKVNPRRFPPTTRSTDFSVRVFKPPVKQPGYLKTWPDPRHHWLGNMYYTMNDKMSLEDARRVFVQGVETTEIKQWLFYS